MLELDSARKLLYLAYNLNKLWKLKVAEDISLEKLNFNKSVKFNFSLP